MQDKLGITIHKHAEYPKTLKFPPLRAVRAVEG